MDKLAEYRSSEEDSSEGLYESDDNDYAIPSVQTKNKHRTCGSMYLPSAKSHSSNSKNNVRTENLDAESTSDTLPEEGEIVSKPISAVKAPAVRKGKLKRRVLLIKHVGDQPTEECAGI
ncbi:uncharacterized protein LOC110456318 isoform X2 [Mizuhopecten yessoensis]|uniref:uncharacterized protein LOC110456318 isoform X2 n=1 Tax=Mizuhopecten yessoensis TaxID=6573 RepID=UPI000B45C2BA|nr:uncharacterized protein LOC110456318 isoform X2 [Mizuhopecten yessoensis]